jgi:stage II sporulation protein D
MRIRLHPEVKLAVVLVLALALLVLAVIMLIKLLPGKDENQTEAVYITIVNSDGENEKIELECFIIGVVAAEMPASFEPAALQAQAVAARTYVLSHCPPYGEPKHGEAAVCCDPAHCQAYADDAALKTRWGDNYAKYYARVEAAVLDTKGEVLCWQGSLIEAAFCSTCGGRTESAAYCWGQDFPYLVAVDCPYCRASPRFCEFRSFTLNEAASLLKAQPQQLAQMRAQSYTAGDRVGLLQVGDHIYQGTEVRSLLSLNSAAFNWLIIGDTIYFSTLGYGHGVGMCQYGANGMAKAGFSYQEILAHYYSGTTLTTITSLD